MPARPVSGRSIDPIPRYRAYQGPAVLSAGFRPFFLAAAIWAAVAVPLWLGAYSGGLILPSGLEPVVWHVHEMIYGFAAAALGVPFYDLHRKIENLPVAALDAQEGTFVKVVGTVVNEPQYWAPRGGGRGGNNYSGAGVVVELDDGGEVLLLAESLSVPDFKGDFDGVHAGDRVPTQGRVVDAVTEQQVTSYGWDPDDLPEASPEGRLLVLHSYP